MHHPRDLLQKSNHPISLARSRDNIVDIVKTQQTVHPSDSDI